MSKFFTSETNYVIHYTNVTTRRASDAPDAFEAEALQAFLADPTLEEYYGIADYEKKGTQVFRYMQPLYMGESCLECHGEPAGELDSFGYAKEGKHVGDIAGAVSIVMPIDLYLEDIEGNIASNVFFYSCILVVGFAVILFGVSRLVTKPLGKLEDATGRIEKGDFDIDVEGIGDRDEIQRLARRFESMAAQLKRSYEDLEGQVRERTGELARANAELERRREQLERANAVLQETNEFKSDFLATMSHELRTPLTSILAFTEIWENMDVERDERERAAVHEVRESGQLLLYMVDNILEMARSEAGKTALSIEPVDMMDLINAVEKPTGFLAQKRSIRLTACVDADVPIIMADWEKLRRIVENLVSNAIKYTRRGRRRAGARAQRRGARRHRRFGGGQRHRHQRREPSLRVRPLHPDRQVVAETLQRQRVGAGRGQGAGGVARGRGVGGKRIQEGEHVFRVRAFGRQSLERGRVTAAAAGRGALGRWGGAARSADRWWA